MLMDGKKPEEIIPYVMDKYRLAKSTAHAELSKARQSIKGMKREQIENIVLTHLDRYEFIYARLVEINANLHALGALKQKEELLGMHNKTYKLRVSEEELRGTTEFIGSTFDESILNKKEQSRMNELISKIASSSAVSKTW